MRKCIFFTLAVLAGLSTFSSCSRLQSESSRIDESLVRAYLRLENMEFNLGEPIIAEVLVANITSKAIPSVWLNNNSLNFFTTRPGITEVLITQPVFSENEQTALLGEIPPDGLWTRKFVFTDITATSGTHTLMVSLNTNPDGSLDESHYHASRVVPFKVTEPRVLKRDRDGVLLKDEAIRIATAKAKIKPQKTQAQLIINEAGFFDWFVIFDTDKGEKQAFLVNPYLGKVRKEISPDLFPKIKETTTPPILKKSSNP